MVVGWVVVGALLFLFELRHLAFYALFGAIGCAAAAITAAVAPSAVALQAAVAVVIAGIGVVAVRPYVSRVFEGRHTGHIARGVHGGIVGQDAVTVDEVGDVRTVGHVRLLGERWLAVSGSGLPIAPHTKVVVTGVQGTTLTVWPVDAVEPGAPPGAISQ